MKIPEEILGSIQSTENIVLCTHIHPDGDALGSLLGFAGILEDMGKSVFCYLEEPVPYLYAFLPGRERVNCSIDDLSAFVAANTDAIAVSLDCGDCDRLGKNKENLLQVKTFLAIDHHRSHKDFGNLRWVEPACSSTGEMVFELAQSLGADISYQSAYNLYVAISTDTGSFRYDSTSSRTLHIAADLVAKGVYPGEVAGHIHDNYTLERIRLMKMVLQTLDLHVADQLAIIHVTQEMFRESGALPEDIEGFIDLPRSINSVKVAAFIKEGNNGVTSVSLRAKGECDVAAIAKSFGGGGHRNASGFRCEGKTVEETHQTVIEVLSSVLQQPSAS
ncbi:MAG: bifunctional oligoribonuclease/PAP phosphatase NrnA [Desulfopila sp.]|jgi:phosphoesterase RecJ-like protein|nr:bifunctional oligoribonuclease/PAP phosphatase NrnA [Desulfopila sp.]